MGGVGDVGDVEHKGDMVQCGDFLLGVTCQ